MNLGSAIGRGGASAVDSPKIKRALLSVSEKMGIADFAKGLVSAGVELFSTGGTKKHLESNDIPVKDITDYTGFPEMMSGRLKTLHPKVYGGILCRRDNDEDMASTKEFGIEPFELIVVNLYPFEMTVAREGVTDEEAIENIDIGGPAMVRAAAKNHKFCTVATNPGQYAEVLEQVEKNGCTTLALRRCLAKDAFSMTAAYDTAISQYFIGRSESPEFPERLTNSFTRKTVLRYGENPHQRAALYVDGKSKSASVVTARQLNGKELSYNNLLDLDAAFEIVRSFQEPAAAVLKHNNPCGVAIGGDLDEALRKAMAGDPMSAFGGILGFNRSVDAACAEYLSTPGFFLEAIVAPDFEPRALKILTTKPKWKANVRLLATGFLDESPSDWLLRPLEGGALLQETDNKPDDESEWTVVTEAKPTEKQMVDLRFAWAVVRYVKSNAITICRDGMLLGAGAGQMSRVDSVEIAVKKAGNRITGSVLASDAFFPFPDGLEAGANAGVTAFIQPGGSKRDDIVIEACNKFGLPMVFTGRRHFKH